MQKVKLNIVPKGVKRLTYLSQNDNGRVVRYELFNELIPYILDGSETITVKVVRPDGEEIISSVPNTEEAYIDVTFNDDMSAIAGVGAGEIKITDGETVLGSHNFDINVEIDAYNGKDVVIETATGTLLSFNTEVEDNALEYESEIPYNAEGYTGLRVINSRTAPIFNKAPYLFRKTPSGNSCIEELNGLSVAFNQLVQNGNFESTDGWGFLGDTAGSSITVSSNYATISWYSRYSNNGLYRPFTYQVNHKYLLSCKVKNISGSSRTFTLGQPYGEKVVGVFNDNEEKYLFGIIEAETVSGQGYNVIALSDGQTDRNNSAIVSNFICFDLTAFFGSPTIADYLYNLETQTAGAGVQKFKELGFDKPYYEYNNGSLLSSKATAKRVIGKNQVDEETILEGYGFTQQSDGSYYSNTFYTILNKSLWENKANYEGTIYLDYDYKYQNSTGSSGIRFSIEYEDGYISGSSPEVVSIYTHFQRVSLSGHGKVKRILFDYGTSNNPTWLKNVSVTFEDSDYEPYKETIYNLGGDELRGLLKLDSNNNIYADGDIKTSDGKIKRKYRYFNDLSSLYWIMGNRNDNDTGYIFYSPQYYLKRGGDCIASKQFVNHTGEVELWEVLELNEIIIAQNYIVLCSSQTSVNDLINELQNIELIYETNTPTTESSTPFDNPQEAGSTEEIIDGNFYDIVDLGSLNWIYSSSLFISTDLELLVKKPLLNSERANAISNYYKIVSRNDVSSYDLSLCIDPDGDIDIRNDNYTDAAAFKAAMSGVYLYYEKSDSAGVEIPLGHNSIYGTDIEYIDIDFNTTIFGGDINAVDGKLSSEYNSDGSVKPTPEVIDITPALIPVKAGDNKIFNSADGDQTIKYYNQVE